MDAREALELATQNAADAQRVLDYYPDDINRMVYDAQGAVLWAVEAWLLAHDIEHHANWGATMETYRKAAGAEASLTANGILSKLTVLGNHPYWYPCEFCNSTPDPERWRADMGDALGRVDEFVAAMRVELGVPPDED